MTDSSHIYHPQSDSLEDRIAAFCTIHRAYKNAEASAALMDDPAWADRLGSREDVQEGLNISKRSLELASIGMTNSDVLKAKQQNWLSQQDEAALVEVIRKQEANQMRSVEKQSTSEQHKQR